MENTALILIDLQNDYFKSFEGAKWQLHETEEAAQNALKILTKFREKNMKVIHVRHEFNIENQSSNFVLALITTNMSP